MRYEQTVLPLLSGEDSLTIPAVEGTRRLICDARQRFTILRIVALKASSLSNCICAFFFFLILDCACIQHDLFSVFMKKRGPLGLSLTPSIVHTSSASNLTF